jgi:Family of unknown function (DUF5995)
MRAKTIDDVLEILARIVADTLADRDPLGYFPALYRQVTLEVKDGIDRGLFDDGQRMARFDALFANAYLEAYAKFRAGKVTSRAWRFAFDRSLSGQLIILQNLLLSINAHINLDLGVVAGKAFPGIGLDDFHDDFDRINDILGSLIPAARDTVEQFSPLLEELTAIGGEDVGLALEFSVDAARDDAWRAATLISLTPSEILPLAIGALDSKAKLLGRVVADPVEPLATVVRRIHRAESTDVAAIIAALDGIVQP